MKQYFCFHHLTFWERVESRFFKKVNVVQILQLRFLLRRLETRKPVPSRVLQRAHELGEIVTKENYGIEEVAKRGHWLKDSIWNRWVLALFSSLPKKSMGLLFRKTETPRTWVHDKARVKTGNWLYVSMILPQPLSPFPKSCIQRLACSWKYEGLVSGRNCTASPMGHAMLQFSIRWTLLEQPMFLSGCWREKIESGMFPALGSILKREKGPNSWRRSWAM